MSSAISLTLSALLGLAADTSCFGRPLDDVVESGRMSVFVYADYAPYSWEEGGDLKGIDVEFGRALADGLGLEVEFIVRQADENVDDDLRVNVWKGDVVEHRAADVMLHVPYDRALEIRSESLAVLFNPYFGEEVAVVVDDRVLPDLRSFAAFSTRPIAVEVDTVSDFFLSAAFNGRLQQSIRRGRTFMDAVALFESGAAPALMASRAQVEWLASRAAGRDVTVKQPPTPGIVRSRWPIGMAVKFDSRDLGYALEDVVARLRTDGRLAEICERYGVTYRPPQLD